MRADQLAAAAENVADDLAQLAYSLGELHCQLDEAAQEGAGQ